MPFLSRTSQRPGVKPTLTRTVGIALALAALSLATTTVPLRALESKTVREGLSDCYEWCDKHNKTEKGRRDCRDSCRKYWYCHGRDAQKYSKECVAFGGTVSLVDPQPPNPKPKKPEVGNTTGGNSSRP